TNYSPIGPQNPKLTLDTPLHTRCSLLTPLNGHNWTNRLTGGCIMTAGALGEKRPTLFLRKATGLVRGWSVRDSLIYACLPTTVVTLGMVEWSYQSTFAQGSLITSILISGAWLS